MKRRSNDESSLELLLDTICNTFGGIVFISLLVVVLLSMSSHQEGSEPPTQDAQLAMKQAEIQREDLTSKLERLKSLAADQELVTGELISQEVITLASELKDAEEQKSTLVVRKSNANGELTKVQSEINNVSVEAQKRSAALNAARDDAEALEKQLEEEIKKKSKEAIIPKARQSRMDTMTYFLKGGKLYGPRLTSNSTDFTTRNTAAGVEVRENPSGGITVKADGSNMNQVAGKFSGISPKDYAIQVFVWPDSYELWERLREILDERDYKKALEPVDEDVVIIEGAVSSGNITIQ